MAPVRRYLRITKYSVLECRIYLDNPALAHSWLLNARNPILPRVIDSVRPWVLPKLREERDRSRKKSSAKKKAIKDVVVEDDFEVSIFLTETNTRHSILTKHKHFHDKAPAKLQSNTNKLLGETNDNPLDLDAVDAAVLREDSEEEDFRLVDIPQASTTRSRNKRQRHATDTTGSDVEDAVSIASDESYDEQPPQKRRKEDDELGADEPAEDEKKKLAMDVSYEGFAIYGRVLCLVVRKRENGAGAKNSSKRAANPNGSKPEGQAQMENWITSTQIPVGEEVL